MKATQVSTGIPWETGTGVACAATAKENGWSLGRVVAMLPAVLVGLVIGTFPFSLPVLYAVALLFME